MSFVIFVSFVVNVFSYVKAKARNVNPFRRKPPTDADLLVALPTTVPDAGAGTLPPEAEGRL